MRLTITPRQPNPPTEATSSPRCKNHLASGISPFASLLSGSGDQDKSDLMLGDAAYGSRENVAACEQAGMTSGILHRNDVTARCKGSGDAWGVSVRDQLGGSPDAKRLDPMSQEEKKENQTYRKARLDYNMRWVVEGVFSLFKRLFGEACNGSQMEEYRTGDTTQGCPVQQMVRRINIWEQVHCR